MAEDRCESVGSWPLVHVHVCFCPVAEIFSHAQLVRCLWSRRVGSTANRLPGCIIICTYYWRVSLLLLAHFESRSARTRLLFLFSGTQA